MTHGQVLPGDTAPPSPHRWACPQGLSIREDVSIVVEDVLHHLVLEDHVHGHVALLAGWPQQRGAEDDGDALHRHAVLLLVLHHPEGTGDVSPAWL